MRYATLAIVPVALCLSSTSFGQDGANPGATFVLHANTGGVCSTVPLPDCTGVQPRVDVNPGELIRVFLFINNAVNAAAMDLAWDWEDSWNIDPNEVGVTYTPCTVNTLTIATPQDPGGPSEGEGRLVTAFDCVTATGAMLIGRMEFAAGTAGCLEFVEVNDVYGTHLVDCANFRNEYNHVTPEEQLRFGKICVTSGGHNACPPVQPVEPATWGRIKASYR